MGKTSGNLSIPFYLPIPATIWETKSCPTETTPALWKQRCISSLPLELFVQKFGSWFWLFAVSTGNGHSNHGKRCPQLGWVPPFIPHHEPSWRSQIIRLWWPWAVQALPALQEQGELLPAPLPSLDWAPPELWSALSSPGAGAGVTLGGLPEEQHMVVWSWSCSSKSSWVWDELWGCHRAGEDRALRAGMRLKVPPTQTSLEFSEPPNQGLSPRCHLPSAASTVEDVQTSPDFVINCCLTGISCGWPVLQTPNALCPPVCLCPIWVFSSCAV